jgi:hypothetical protein
MSYAMVSQSQGVGIEWHHNLQRELGDESVEGLTAMYAGTSPDGLCVISVWEVQGTRRPVHDRAAGSDPPAARCHQGSAGPPVGARGRAGGCPGPVSRGEVRSWRRPPGTGAGAGHWSSASTTSASRYCTLAGMGRS